MSAPVAIALRVAPTAPDRQRALVEWLADGSDPPRERAVLVEGAFATLDAGDVPVVSLGAGCVCCAGSVPLRVALTRLLRERRPRAVLLLIADDSHLARVARMIGDGAWGVPMELDWSRELSR